MDLCEPDLEDLELVADELGLHRLAVEDATRDANDPSSTATRATTSSPPTRCTWTRQTGELVTGEIAAFITPTALVTVRQDDGLPDRRPAAPGGTTTPT